MNLNLELAGPPTAPAVLLSNALGATLEMWDRQVPALSERFRVIRYDARGHTRSAAPPGPYSIDDFGRDAVTVLDGLGVEHANVCGVSLGGMTAMWLGIHAPERVDRLVLCCTSAKLGPPEIWRERAAIVRAEGTEGVAEAGVGRWLTDHYAREHPETAKALRSMIAGNPAEGYASSCAAIERMDLTHDLHRIGAPTLVIAADQDPSTPPEHGELIAERIRGARLHVIEGAAHLANVERAGEVNDLILEFLGG